VVIKADLVQKPNPRIVTPNERAERLQSGDTFHMSYFDDARLRAKRRKSPWNLLLIPTIAIPWLGAWSYTVIAVDRR
jgi:hypothetical protein